MPPSGTADHLFAGVDRGDFYIFSENPGATRPKLACSHAFDSYFAHFLPSFPPLFGAGDEGWTRKAVMARLRSLASQGVPTASPPMTFAGDSNALGTAVDAPLAADNRSDADALAVSAPHVVNIRSR
jgi:hypothetical protein